MRKIRQNLFFGFVCNAAGIPTAVGALYSFTGMLLSPIIATAGDVALLVQRRDERSEAE